MSVKLYSVIPLVYDGVATRNAYYFKRLRSTWSATTLLIASFVPYRVSVGKTVFHRLFGFQSFLQTKQSARWFCVFMRVCVCVCVYVCAYVCTRRKPLRNESRWTRGITRREKQLRKKFNLFLECLRVARIISKIFRLFCKYTGCQKEEFYKDWRRFSHSSKGVKYVSINIGNCFDEKINFFYCPSFCIFYISIQIIVLLF